MVTYRLPLLKQPVLLPTGHIVTSTQRSEETIAPEVSSDRWAPLAPCPSIDGLRGLAVIIVVLYHGGWFRLKGGFVGVDVFFVLSGFLITRLMIDEQLRNGEISIKRFYIRRALRLLPALFGLIAGVWAAALLLDIPELRADLSSRTFWALSYLSNWNDVLTDSHGGPFGHLWSLSVEEQFYVIWPLIVIAAHKRGGYQAVRSTAAVLSAIFAVNAAIRIRSGASVTDIYFATDTHGAPLLLAGSWLGASPHLVAAITRRLASQLVGLGLIGIAILAFLPGRGNPFHAEIGYLPIAACSLAAVAGAAALPSHRLLTVAPLRWVGKASYGIYLWHIPMFAITATLVPNMDSRLAIVGASLLAAGVSYYAIERPALRLKHRFS